MDWEVDRFGDVPNEPGIDISNINSAIPDLLPRHNRSISNLIIGSVREDGIKVAPYGVEHWMNSFSLLLFSPIRIIDGVGDHIMEEPENRHNTHQSAGPVLTAD